MLELHIYDFDQTLYRSPVSPEWWKQKQHGFWWDATPSLEEDFIEGGAWKDGVVMEAKQSISDPNVYAILCTGRADKGDLRYRVAELLRSKGLNFDEVFLKPNAKMDTAVFKGKTAGALLLKHTDISRVVMWDDDADNLRAVEAVCKRGGVAFEGHKVTSDDNVSTLSESQYLELSKRVASVYISRFMR
jgi:hypothetical protein